MPKIKRLSVFALVAALVITLATPASAADRVTTARREREAARAKRAQIAAKLNALKASDQELENAVNALNRQVAAQMASAASARQAYLAALQTSQDAEAELAETDRQITALQGAVVTRAVASYMRPQDDEITPVLNAKDIGEATRRSSLLSEVASRNSDTIDRLRSARQDQAERRAKLQRARDLANQRRQAEVVRLTELTHAQQEKARLAKALDDRIADYTAEADEIAKTEASLSAYIQQRSAARASRGAGDPGTDGRVSGAGLIWPVRGPVTSGFGYRWGRLHAGIDIGAGTGTPIRAAKGGEVIFSGQQSGYGNVIIIDHGGGFTTLYAHQSRLGARDGQTVSQGEVIGYVGSTGHSTGPHLHFETRVNGSPRDPRNYLP